MIAIVAAKRSPSGKFMGQFSPLQAQDIASPVIQSCFSGPTKALAAKVTHAYIGHAIQAGSGQNSGRQAVLNARLSSSVHTTTLNKVCGSGMQSIVEGMRTIMCKKNAVVVVGGMEAMSFSPHYANLRHIRKKGPVSKTTMCENKRDELFQDSLVSEGLFCAFTMTEMGSLAELLVKKYNITRTMQDTFSLESHKKAAHAAKKGWFAHEITSVMRKNKDETIRPNTSLKKLAALDPVFSPQGTITAGNASPLSDGASALVLMHHEEAKRQNIPVLGIIEGFSEESEDPTWYTTAPIRAVHCLMNQQNLSYKDVDILELNEAFAVQSLAVMNNLPFDRKQWNVHGGALALGHPIGCSGARIVTTLVHALHQHNKQRGIATLCIGGGEALALSITR